ncbi:MAG TPA: type II toxin-antitoxin system VapC family toxin [Gaiellaceae bacterium]|nr:type II toxin-antitoxin system VapC family toxin [Gaiellaceae bacterium]
MPADIVVPDSSAALRALHYDDKDALDWFARIDSGEVRAWWPELALLEIANALRTAVATSVASREHAVRTMERARAWPIRAIRLTGLVTPALIAALDRSLSTYDASYVVLAEVLGARLITADRKLAAATANAVLIS